MQDIVGKALGAEQNRLTAMLRRDLGSPDIDRLQSLLEDAKGV
jgi:hypothetical protein